MKLIRRIAKAKGIGTRLGPVPEEGAEHVVQIHYPKHKLWLITDIRDYRRASPPDRWLARLATPVQHKENVNERSKTHAQPEGSAHCAEGCQEKVGPARARGHA